ncbi:MAG: YceI family protein [Granulosicoccus sp.]|nr:YceI family protein [Granulosicoccus sp.]
MVIFKPSYTSAVLTSLIGFSSLASVQAADLSAVPSGMYEIDPTHAYINFQYNHLGLSKPTLSFDEFTVEMDLDNADPTNSTINVSIDPASVISGSEIWTEHLTGGDWFDVANHPEITFTSTGIEAAGDGAFKVSGDLTVKGESSPVELAVTINAAMNHPMSGKPVIGLEASSELLRSDFGLGKFAPNVSDEVSLSIQAEMLHAEK